MNEDEEFEDCLFPKKQQESKPQKELDLTLKKLP